MTYDCRTLQASLDAWAGEALSAEEHAAARRHVEECAACRDAAERARAWSEVWRRRLQSETAPPALAARIRTAITTPEPAWYARALGSSWAPRLAMAAVLAVLVLIPLAWLGRGTPALATGAATRYACHAADPGAPHPCCTPLPVKPGDTLGPPSPGVRIVDLPGLQFAGATHCTFGGGPVNAVGYTQDGARFSLYTTDQGIREFRLLRHEAPNGVPEWRHAVELQRSPNHPAGRHEVAIWRRDDTLFTWVGPAGAAFEAGLAALQSTP